MTSPTRASGVVPLMAEIRHYSVCPSRVEMPEATNALPKEIISWRHFKVLEVLVKPQRTVDLGPL